MNKTKGWNPPVYRKSYKKRYGPGCFLKPKTQKYPICKNGKIDCKGLRAAAYYARLLKNKNTLKKARNLSRKCI
jgi:hypothetical protein